MKHLYGPPTDVPTLLRKRADVAREGKVGAKISPAMHSFMSQREKRERTGGSDRSRYCS